MVDWWVYKGVITPLFNTFSMQLGLGKIEGQSDIMGCGFCAHGGIINVVIFINV